MQQSSDITDLSPEVKYYIVQQIEVRLQEIGGHKNGESQVLMGRPVSTEGQWIQKHGRGRLIAITMTAGLILSALQFTAAAGTLLWLDKEIKSQHSSVDSIILFIVFGLFVTMGLMMGGVTLVKTYRICRTPSRIQLTDSDT